jgi:hypothetical protein
MSRSTLLAAVAASWSLDIAPLLIRAGLKNFGQQTRAEQALTPKTNAT